MYFQVIDLHLYLRAKEKQTGAPSGSFACEHTQLGAVACVIRILYENTAYFYCSCPELTIYAICLLLWGI